LPPTDLGCPRYRVSRERHGVTRRAHRTAGASTSAASPRSNFLRGGNMPTTRYANQPPIDPAYVFSNQLQGADAPVSETINRGRQQEAYKPRPTYKPRRRGKRPILMRLLSILTYYADSNWICHRSRGQIHRDTGITCWCVTNLYAEL